MKALSRLASRSEGMLGIAAALLFWLADAALEYLELGTGHTYLDFLLNPATPNFHSRLVATLLILAMVLVGTYLLRRKEDSEARLQHSHFLLKEMALELQSKNEAMGKEIMRRKAIEKRLAELADTDQLTGIHNRRRFDELLTLELNQEARYERGLCLAILDIDHFKAINDLYGHAVGDKVLKEFAHLIEKNRRKADAFFRIGGEEFSLITFADNGKNLDTACEKVRASVANHHFKDVPQVTISIGASQYQPGDDYDSLFRRADSALYKAKEGGRNKVAVV